jgi:hypothetical protein
VSALRNTWDSSYDNWKTATPSHYSGAGAGKVEREVRYCAAVPRCGRKFTWRFRDQQFCDACHRAAYPSRVPS